MRGLNFNGLENVLLVLFSQESIVFLFWSVFLPGFFSDVPISVTLGLWIVCLEGVYYLSLRCPKKHVFKHYVAVKTWGSFLPSILILVWPPPGMYVHSRPMQPCCVWAAVKNTCHLTGDGKEQQFCCLAEFSTPDWPPMFQGQKSSKILICRCVTVPSADFWRGGLVLTCGSQANCLLIQFETLQFGIH